MLFTLLRRRGIYTASPGWLAFGWKLALALFAMSVALWITAGPSAAWIAAGAHARILRLCIVIAAGVLAYFGTLWLLGFRLRDFNQRAAE
jgi:putative peptidoglycan lipid II flippase